MPSLRFLRPVYIACLGIGLASQPEINRESCPDRSGEEQISSDGSALLLLQVNSNVVDYKAHATERSDVHRWHPDIHAYIRYLEALESHPAPLLEITSAVDRAVGNETVFFIVMSDSNNYGTRLRWISDSWAHDWPSSLLLAIGDRAKQTGEADMNVASTRCPAHTHDGACCKEAEAVITAYKKLQEQSGLGWAYIVDDDAYVRPSAVQARLDRVNPLGENKKGILAAVQGCHTKNCPAGFCGGGGVALNRQALDTLVGSSPAAYLKEHMSTCSRCEMWGDVTLGTQASEHKITPLQLTGLNGWFMSKTKFDAQLQHHTDDEPLMYHYIKTEGQMQFLHQLFAKEDGNSSRLAQDESSMGCATYGGKTHCTSDNSSWPWSQGLRPFG